MHLTVKMYMVPWFHSCDGRVACNPESLRLLGAVVSPLFISLPSIVVIRIAVQTTGKFEAGFCDCCAEPGGCGRCLYVYCFPCCAAGDAAQKVSSLVVA